MLLKLTGFVLIFAQFALLPIAKSSEIDKCFTVTNIEDVNKTEQCLIKKHGEASAHYMLARYFLDNNSDLVLGEKFLVSSLFKDNLEAMVYYAGLLFNGIHFPMDKKIAIFTYEDAAEKGSLAALQNLGAIYLFQNNPVKASAYLLRAFEKEQTYTGMLLGLLYFLQGDIPKADKYFIESFNNGNIISLIYYAYLLEELNESKYCDKQIKTFSEVVEIIVNYIERSGINKTTLFIMHRLKSLQFDGDLLDSIVDSEKKINELLAKLKESAKNKNRFCE